MEVLVFKTNLDSTRHVASLELIFNTHPNVSEWSVDTDDIDRVLRVVPSGSLLESEIISLISSQGFDCIPLTD